MEKNKIISPYFEDGAFAGVRVCIGGEDFVIAPKDYQNGKGMTYQSAMNALKADNLSTWNYRQTCLTMAYREEIDKVLKNNDGDNLRTDYWIYEDTEAFTLHYYDGFYGTLGYNYNYMPYSVRPIKNLKNS